MGTLYAQLNGNDWLALDRYEGSEYERIEVRLKLGSRTVNAQTYLFRFPGKDLTAQRWDYQYFISNQCESFLRKCSLQ